MASNQIKDESLTLKPMRKILVSDEVIEQIRNLIRDGTLKPGDSLPTETKMAGQMRVGRSTIREAFKVLIHLGLIERRNKMTFVAEHVAERLFPYDIVDRFHRNKYILDMIEFRKIIEPDVAFLAATRREAADIEMILVEVEAMTEQIEDRKAFLAHDHLFHVRLGQISRNPILMEIMRSMKEALEKNQETILRRSKNIHPRSLNYHWKIFEAIKAGKPKSAKRVMAEHILDLEKELYIILKQEK